MFVPQDNQAVIADADIQPHPDKSFFKKKGEQLLQNLKICAVTALSHLIQYTHTVDKDNADLILLVLLDGEAAINKEGEDPVYCYPGDALLMTIGLIHQVHIDNTISLAIIDIPATLVDSQISNPNGNLIKKISSASMPALRLLVGYTKVLVQIEDCLPSDLALLVSTQIHSLAAQLFSGKQEEVQVAGKCHLRTERLEAIKRDILEHITESELSINQVARHQGISSQYIRTLFHSEGTTFADYVAELRLDQVYRHLCNPASTDHCISTLAFDMGFNNLSWFNRAFKQRFGQTPSQVRNLSRRSTDRL